MRTIEGGLDSTVKRLTFTPVGQPAIRYTANPHSIATGRKEREADKSSRGP